EAALDVLPEDGRFMALAVRGRIAYWVGDFETRERVGEEMLEIARRLERKDLEAQALDGLADVYKHQQRLDEAEALVRRALELADESGSIVAKAQALFSLGRIYVVREDPVEGERLFEE